MQFHISSRRENRESDTWVIKIRVLRNVFSKQKTLDPEDNTFGLLNKTSLGDLPFLRTLFSNRILRAKFLKSGRCFSFISICKFGSFNNTLAMINSLSELYFRFRRFIMLVQTKCTWHLQWVIYTSIQNWNHWHRVTSSSRRVVNTTAT